MKLETGNPKHSLVDHWRWSTSRPKDLGKTVNLFFFSCGETKFPLVITGGVATEFSSFGSFIQSFFSLHRVNLKRSIRKCLGHITPEKNYCRFWYWFLPFFESRKYSKQLMLSIIKKTSIIELNSKISKFQLFCKTLQILIKLIQ